MRRSRAQQTDEDASRVLAVLSEHSDYEQRMEELLGLLRDAAGLPDAYLYVGDPGARRLHLELTRARPAEDPTRVAPGPMAQVAEGGAEWIAPTPPLEIVRSDDLSEARVITSPVGALFSLPLVLRGSLIGLIQVGPLQEGEMPARPRERVEAIADRVALVVEQARAQQLLRMQLAAVSAREQMGRRLAGSALDADRFLTLLLDLALKATRSEGGFVAVADPETQQLAVRVAQGMADDFAERVDLAPETGLFDWSLGGEGALVIRDFDQILELGIRSLLAVPLTEAAQPLGVFALATFTEEAGADVRGLELLETYATQATLMLHNARLFAGFSDRYLETVMGLARSLDARRPYLEGHHELVAGAADAIARALQADAAELDAIRTAALMHDVGMAAVAEDEGAFEANLEHPMVGATMVEHLPLSRDVAQAIATHHEWFDGWGFPQGLSGEQIPRAGRILAAAEFLVEMASPAPVREGYGSERLADELEERRGSQFDPELVDAILPLVRSGELAVNGLAPAAGQDG